MYAVTIQTKRCIEYVCAKSKSYIFIIIKKKSKGQCGSRVEQQAV